MTSSSYSYPRAGKFITSIAQSISAWHKTDPTEHTPLTFPTELGIPHSAHSLLNRFARVHDYSFLDPPPRLKPGDS